MIPLTLECMAQQGEPFVAKVLGESDDRPGQPEWAVCRVSGSEWSMFESAYGEFSVKTDGENLAGDVLFVEPAGKVCSRWIRRRSAHNTLLVTERCDQLCVMCSQPPKKSHVDRFKYFERACLLADSNQTIGISGGEPTLYKAQLFHLIGAVLTKRPDLSFHVLTNGQHFEPSDIPALRRDVFQKVLWGVPLYAPDAVLHDSIVGKDGAFDELQARLSTMVSSGLAIELRTVLMQVNAEALPSLSTWVTTRLPTVAIWAIMQLENTGYARKKWDQLFFDHSTTFAPVGEAIGYAEARGIRTALYNFPLCTVPTEFREKAADSISDWKKRFSNECVGCTEQSRCSGFFEWHPETPTYQGFGKL